MFHQERNTTPVRASLATVQRMSREVHTCLLKHGRALGAGTIDRSARRGSIGVYAKGWIEHSVSERWRGGTSFHVREQAM
jgi:hypothetical protein